MNSAVDLLGCFGTLSCCTISVLLHLKWQVVAMAFSCKEFYTQSLLETGLIMMHPSPCFTVRLHRKSLLSKRVSKETLDVLQQTKVAAMHDSVFWEKKKALHINYKTSSALVRGCFPVSKASKHWFLTSLTISDISLIIDTRITKFELLISEIHEIF